MKLNIGIFLLSQLKLQETQVDAMAKHWLKSLNSTRSGLAPVEEALLYGAKSNPMQCFRVVRKICRKTNKEEILKALAVNLLEDLAAYSALKIKREILNECRINRNFKLAISHIYLSKKDKGYFFIKRLVEESHYL